MSPKSEKKNMKKEKMIGIVGGVGPYAGLDLMKKIFDSTLAEKDQEHLSVTLISAPVEIEDRTSFLTGNSNVNPGHAMASIIERLEKSGAEVIGIPCNTAHAPDILDAAKKELSKKGSKVNLLHMIHEVTNHIKATTPAGEKIGLLCTIGLADSRLYQEALEKAGLEPTLPDKNIQAKVQDSIYNPSYGLKAKSNPVTPQARNILKNAIESLKSKGAKVVILGCTELPLAFQEKEEENGVRLIDSTLVLARALVREAAPDKLKPMNNY
jgi:aspartate racemase